MNIEQDLDEATLRWPTGFTEGMWIELNDGQRWAFPPLDNGDVDLLNIIAAAGSRLERLGPIFELGYRKLCRNYALTRDQIKILFPYHPADWQTTPDREGPSAAVLAAANNRGSDGRERMTQITDDFKRYLGSGVPTDG